MSSLLDDLEADYHQYLLKEGNLHPRRKTDWTGDNQWESQGYIARVNRIECKCGAHHTTLVGAFHREKTPSGKVREIALHPRSQVPIGSPVEVQIIQAQICPSCLSSMGFAEFPK